MLCNMASVRSAQTVRLYWEFSQGPFQDNTQTGSHRPNQAVLTAARAAQPTTSAPRQTVWYIHGGTTSCTHSARRATTVWTKPDPNHDSATRDIPVKSPVLPISSSVFRKSGPMRAHESPPTVLRSPRSQTESQWRAGGVVISIHRAPMGILAPCRYELAQLLGSFVFLMCPCIFISGPEELATVPKIQSSTKFIMKPSNASFKTRELP